MSAKLGKSWQTIVALSLSKGSRLPARSGELAPKGLTLVFNEILLSG